MLSLSTQQGEDGIQCLARQMLSSRDSAAQKLTRGLMNLLNDFLSLDVDFFLKCFKRFIQINVVSCASVTFIIVQTCLYISVHRDINMYKA